MMIVILITTFKFRWEKVSLRHSTRFLKSNEKIMLKLYESASLSDKGYIIDFNIDSANGALSFKVSF